MIFIGIMLFIIILELNQIGQLICEFYNRIRPYIEKGSDKE